MHWVRLTLSVRLGVRPEPEPEKPRPTNLLERVPRTIHLRVGAKTSEVTKAKTTGSSLGAEKARKKCRKTLSNSNILALSTWLIM
jgi:hypothetical protein